MKVLHTSDWHLGRSLYGRKRHAEFEAFLDWLVQKIKEHEIDVLLVAGDVFDTCTPTNKAQELYYNFLRDVSLLACRHVIVIGGNHDSPSFINAPKQLLRAFNIHVVGAKTGDLSDEVIVLRQEGEPEAIVCAVPYLRDKDIRTIKPGETIADKNAKLIAGLRQHYIDVCAIAEQKREEFQKDGYENIPIIAMGHLFTAGGVTADGDGVRELYVGTIAHVRPSVFPSSINYLALGHLHVPQVVGGAQHIRYCGSPIPMGFGEAGQQKQVVLVEFEGVHRKIEEIPIPCFQELVRIVGSLEDITAKIKHLKQQGSSAWLEIEYTGEELVSNLPEMLEVELGGAMEIRRIKNRRVIEHVFNTMSDDEPLDDLDVDEVFNHCLDAHSVVEKDRKELVACYNEIVMSLQEDDINAD